MRFPSLRARTLPSPVIRSAPFQRGCVGLRMVRVTGRVTGTIKTPPETAESRCRRSGPSGWSYADLRRLVPWSQGGMEHKENEDKALDVD